MGFFYEEWKSEPTGYSDLGDVVLDNIPLAEIFHTALLTACLQHIDIQPLNVIRKRQVESNQL